MSAELQFDIHSGSDSDFSADLVAPGFLAATDNRYSQEWTQGGCGGVVVLPFDCVAHAQ